MLMASAFFLDHHISLKKKDMSAQFPKFSNPSLAKMAAIVVRRVSRIAATTKPAGLSYSTELVFYILFDVFGDGDS